MSENAGAKPVLVFDSGIGGLSVLRHIRLQLPDTKLIYVADTANFPYGNWEAGALSAHIVALMGKLIAAYDPAAVVIACNTASTLVLPVLRATFDVPFVGTVPAIKPAAAQTVSGLVSVLATPGTIARDYTRQLIKDFAAQSTIELVATPRLATIAENYIKGGDASLEAIAQEIAPAFVEHGGKRTDMVVLACTHYPFLIEQMERVAPWPVTWIDPAPAIAKRLVSLVGDGAGPEGSFAVFTDGAAVSAGLAELLEGMGLSFETA
ncbi:MAG: glutamate racemase [Parvibaculaceae bacterium]